MDIHAPERPIHTFKDFALHIAIVTIGIVIALGLEGIRESVHDHRLIRETRENFRTELTESHKHIVEEIARVTAGRERLDNLVRNAPALARDHPEQVLAELEAVSNPNYFFGTNSWQAALSSGVLAHMGTDEISAYAWTAEGARIHTKMQDETRTAEGRAVAFWMAHPHPTPEQAEQGLELIALFDKQQDVLASVAPQIQRSIDNALRAASR